MGKVSVLLFARLAEIAGTRKTEIETREGLRVSDVLPILEASYPGVIDMSVVLRYAVNREFVPEDHALHDGDEVALIPPVSGGCNAL
jgi:molybdopterin converting factor subunit 1